MYIVHMTCLQAPPRYNRMLLVYSSVTGLIKIHRYCQSCLHLIMAYCASECAVALVLRKNWVKLTLKVVSYLHIEHG